MTERNTCIICGRPVQGEDVSPAHNVFVSCPNCGDYLLTYRAYLFLEHERDFIQCLHDNQPRISGYLREEAERRRYGDGRTRPAPLIDTEDWQQILYRVDDAAPKTVSNKVDKLLQFVARRAEMECGVGVLFDYDEPAVAYAKSRNELDALIRSAEQKGYLRCESSKLDCECELTVEGMERIEQLGRVETTEPPSTPAVVINGGQVGQVNIAQGNAVLHAESQFSEADLKQLRELMEKLLTALPGEQTQLRKPVETLVHALAETKPVPVLPNEHLEQVERLLQDSATVPHAHIPAAVLAGAVLEKGLRELCLAQNPPLPVVTAQGKELTLNPLIEKLLHGGVISDVTAAHLRAWATIRNKAAHGQFGEFTRQDVEQMLSGIKTFFQEHC